MGYIDKNGHRKIELPSHLSELYGCCYFHGTSFKDGLAKMSITEFGFDCNCHVKLLINEQGQVVHSTGKLLDKNTQPVPILKD